MNRHLSNSLRKLELGFSMLEVLITLVIIAIALLGTAGLQIYAMRTGQSSQLRNQAVFLASDMAERMEANKPGSIAANYTVAATNTVVTAPVIDCAAASCSAANLATWDIYQWEAALVSVLPQVSSWQVTAPVCVIITSAPTSCSYQIIISWTDRRTDTNYAAYNAATSTGINAANTGERFSYTATRTIVN